MYYISSTIYSAQFFNTIYTWALSCIMVEPVVSSLLRNGLGQAFMGCVDRTQEGLQVSVWPIRKRRHDTEGKGERKRDSITTNIYTTSYYFL